MIGGVVQLDDTYLARLRRRDPETLRSVVDEQGRRLYRAARGMGYSTQEAEDLVQDVFVTFIGSLERFEGRAQVGTWLFGILHHKSQERRRTVSREELNDPIDDVFESQFDARGHWVRPPIAPDRQATAHETARAIQACLEGLSPVQRDVFQLRQVEELSAAEVCKISGQTVTHIGVLFHRARMKLRECLERKGWGRSR
ncbi:MAG: RNA polymerase sigma factor [Acidobacteria bacterium]|nr:RNA polymerase sigma factor [Acidobacteriota bacterium]